MTIIISLPIPTEKYISEPIIKALFMQEMCSMKEKYSPSKYSDPVEKAFKECN